MVVKFNSVECCKCKLLFFNVLVKYFLYIVFFVSWYRDLVVVYCIFFEGCFIKGLIRKIVFWVCSVFKVLIIFL